MRNHNLFDFFLIVSSQNPIKKYQEYTSLIREKYNNKILIDIVDNENFENEGEYIPSNDIKVLFILYEYYFYTCFFPNEEDIRFYNSNGIKYEKLKWNIDWNKIQKEILNLNNEEKEDIKIKELNNTFIILLQYFSSQIIAELIDLYKVINRQSNTIISLKSMIKQVTLVDKRIRERIKTKSKKQVDEFEQIINDQNELLNITKKIDTNNLGNIKTFLNKLKSDDIEKYYLYPIIIHFSKGKESNYLNIYPLIRLLLPNRNKYRMSSNKYWFKDLKEFNDYSHLNQTSYLSWNEYCTTKVKNFIKRINSN